MQFSPGVEREAKIHAAWSHAVKNISDGRMSNQKGLCFWRPIFEIALLGEKLPASKHKIFDDYPTIPDDIQPDEKTKWGPTALAPPKIEAHQLSTTILDHMLAASASSSRCKVEKISTLAARTQSVVPETIWSWERIGHIRRMPDPVREGMLVSALLYTKLAKLEGHQDFWHHPSRHIKMLIIFPYS